MIISTLALNTYKILGPKKVFIIAMSPPGKLLLKLLLQNKKLKLRITTKYGFLLEASKYELYMSGYAFLNETNPFETYVLRNLLKKGDTFIDIGAYIGWYSLNAKQIVGDEGKVIAFEPNPICFEQLQRNCDINHFDITLESLALSDKIGNTDFWIGDEMAGSFIEYNTQSISSVPVHKIKVKTTSLEDYCKEKNIKNITLIKIDVEGAEMLVLAGAQKILKRDSPYLIIEVAKEHLKAAGSSKTKLFSFLKKNGYSLYGFVSNGLREIQDENFSQQTANVFFAKDKKRLRNLINRAS